MFQRGRPFRSMRTRWRGWPRRLRRSSAWGYGGARSDCCTMRARRVSASGGAWKAASRSIIRRRERRSLSVGMESAGNSWHTPFADITAECPTVKFGQIPPVQIANCCGRRSKIALAARSNPTMLSSSWSRQGKSTFPMLPGLEPLCTPVERSKAQREKRSRCSCSSTSCIPAWSMAITSIPNAS